MVIKVQLDHMKIEMKTLKFKVRIQYRTASRVNFTLKNPLTISEDRIKSGIGTKNIAIVFYGLFDNVQKINRSPALK